ncbi:hypothetical protein CHARACLAT_000312 [Characodon lateralis]|uniref:AHNAK nucleoprotein n=1 Tax=Characodon lateralis TaxID=208331 RepID=A0ABU7DWG4_9TELE|nr:hypothetical protein [Characodon lateralis]
MDLSIPKIKGDIKSPEIDIKGPEVDIEGPKGGYEMPKIKMPSLSLKGPKVDVPDVDINLKGPKVKGDVDVALPKMKGDLKGPEVDIEGPDVDIEGHKGGLKMPKFKMPSFGFKGPKVEGPDVDIDISNADIDMKAPDVDIEGADIDIKGPNAKLKGPNFNMPSVSGPQISMPNVNFNLKGPKLKGDMDLSTPKIKGDIKPPEIDIKGPKVDIEGPKSGITSLSFHTEDPKLDTNLRQSSEHLKFPTIPGSNIALPDVDINLKDSEIKGNFKGDGQFPKAKLKEPYVKTDFPELSTKKPKFKMPKVGFRSLKTKTSETDIKLEHGDVNIKGMSGSCEGLDHDIGLTGSKPKGSKFKMPKFGLKGSKVDMSEADLPKPSIEIKTSDISTAGPELDIHGEKVKGPKMKVSAVSGPKISMPDVDLNVKGPNLKGDLDVSVPKMEGEPMPDVDLNLKGPKMKFAKDLSVHEADFKGPKVEVEGPKVGFEMPKIKIPSFGIKLPQLESSNDTITIPNANTDTVTHKMDTEVGGVDIECPSANLKNPKMKLPKTDVRGADIEIESPSGKIQGPTFKMPSLSGPNISMPNADLNLKGPKLESDKDVSNIKGKITTCEADIKGPEVNLEGPKGGFEISKIKIPSVDIKGPETGSLGVDIILPKAKVPDVEAEFPEAKFKPPKIKLPTVSSPESDINLKGSNAEGPEINVNLPKTDIDIKGPTMSMPDVDMNLKAPKIKTDVKASKMERKITPSGPEVDENFPKANIKGEEFDATEASLDAPDIDINVKGKKGKFKLPKVTGKARKPEADIKTPDVDLGVDTTDIHVKGTKAKKPLFGRLHFPGVELDIKSPKLKGDGSLAEGLKSHDTDIAQVCVEGPDVKVKGGPELSFSAQKAGGLRYPEGTVPFPKINVPKFGIILPKVEGQDDVEKDKSELTASSGTNPESQSFSLQVSSQNIDIPSPELKHGEAKAKTKMQKLFGKSKAKGSSTGELCEPELGLSGKEGKATKIHSGEMMGGNLDLEGDSRVSLSTKEKSASLDLFKKSKHQSSFASDEGSLAISSPSACSEAECGDISIDVGGSKVKGKKGKLKFGTFGGFGSKSKGSYEVTLENDNEGEIEGSTNVSVPLKKSRLSSSSSSDSGSKRWFQVSKT